MYPLKYLRRPLTATDDNWPVVIVNLRKDRKISFRLARILGQEGTDTRTSGRFYVVVVQAILLFRSNMWVATPRIKLIWGGVLPQGGKADLGEYTSETDGGDVGVPYFERCDEGSGT